MMTGSQLYSLNLAAFADGSSDLFLALLVLVLLDVVAAVVVVVDDDDDISHVVVVAVDDDDDDDDDDDISHVVVVAVGWLNFIIGSGCFAIRVDNELVSAF